MSARLDGEASAAESAALDAHLASCAECRSVEERLAEITRVVRDRPSDPVPDPTAVLRAAWQEARRRDAAEPEGERPGRAAILPLPLLGGSSCGCAASCRCGCQDGAPCRCDPRVA
jgi:anti-sigma factor RsiW